MNAKLSLKHFNLKSPFNKRMVLLVLMLGFICPNLFAQKSNSDYTCDVKGGKLEGGPFEFTVSDGEADNIPEGAITLSGNSGTNSAWVITDDQGNILGLPPNPYVVNFDGAGPGTCLVWHLSFEDGLEGAEVGANADDLEGCYNLSNPIEVFRNEAKCDVDGGKLDGGPFEFCVGDDKADNIPEGAITLTDNVGTNSAWVVTDDQGNILGLPPSPYVVNFDGAGPGTCLVWHLSFEDGLEGAEVGANAADLEGCYSLSNPIAVYRLQPVGGTLEGGPFEFTVDDGEADNIPEGAITLSGNSGTNSAWVITDDQGNILGLPPSPYVVNFDGAGPGTCLVWHLSFEDGLEGAEVGANAADLEGCYSLSNPIEVFRNEATCDVEGGKLDGGPFEFTVSDGIADNIPEGAISLTDNVGTNSAWVVTDDQGNILGLPPSPYVVNFDGAGPGTCLVWHLSFEDGLEGAEVGANAADLEGCYSLSNPIEVFRNEASCDVDGGKLSSDDLYIFCVGDGEADYATGIKLYGNSGGISQWVVTDVQGNILGLPPSPEVVDFDGAGEGVCLVWHLEIGPDFEGGVVGNNAFTDLSGCYDLSNPIPVFRFDADGLLCELLDYLYQPSDIDVKLYPNPTVAQVNIDLSSINEEVDVTIYSITNIEVYNQTSINPTRTRSLQINTSQLKSGLYLVSVKNNKGEVLAVKRLIIE